VFKAQLVFSLELMLGIQPLTVNAMVFLLISIGAELPQATVLLK